MQNSLQKLFSGDFPLCPITTPPFLLPEMLFPKQLPPHPDYHSRISIGDSFKFSIAQPLLLRGSAHSMRLLAHTVARCLRLKISPPKVSAAYSDRQLLPRVSAGYELLLPSTRESPKVQLFTGTDWGIFRNPKPVLCPASELWPFLNVGATGVILDPKRQIWPLW